MLVTRVLNTLCLIDEAMHILYFANPQTQQTDAYHLGMPPQKTENALPKNSYSYLKFNEDGTKTLGIKLEEGDNNILVQWQNQKCVLRYRDKKWSLRKEGGGKPPHFDSEFDHVSFFGGIEGGSQVFERISGFIDQREQTKDVSC